MKSAKNAISPTRKENYAEWYQQVIRAADLAESSPVRGCMVIKPWGYAIWERMQVVLDSMIKETGHVNAYFPLFIPKSFFEKEAAHVEGFAKECAVVTHSRLVPDGNGRLKPASPLEEPLIVRPTSETIIGESFSRWVQSYRDLPLLINQWANVVRWEMRTRLFLRTSEFLWQEGHTAHASQEEAKAEAMRMLEVYRVFAEEHMAMPVICGQKPESERFPGAVETLAIEAMMQDGKALQAGTSHFLGQNFARACNIQFADPDGKLTHAWTTSWGVSTRLMGGLIMVHSDDDGLVLPPQLAPQQIVILPILHNAEETQTILDYCETLRFRLRAKTYHGQTLRVLVDTRDRRGGEKSWEWIKKGVPIRAEAGARELQSGHVSIVRRDNGQKNLLQINEFVEKAEALLADIQESLFRRAMELRAQKSKRIGTYAEFKEFFQGEGCGFAETFFSFDGEAEEKIRSMGITPRCIPLASNSQTRPCFVHPDRPGQFVIWAKSY
ncbi:MAG: proline--tRNA ligase [Puniceicoccales bacterium]|jgi:prolyl-tRNA synthetase|nr:proline--tRNA ligase [Puniceicoccales bacterium]